MDGSDPTNKVKEGKKWYVLVNEQPVNLVVLAGNTYAQETKRQGDGHWKDEYLCTRKIENTAGPS